MCSQEDRFSRLYKFCPAPKIDDVDKMPDKQLKFMARYLHFSDKLKIVVCLHYKVAWTSLAAIMINNSADEVLPPQDNMELKDYFILGDEKSYSADEIRHRLKTYYKFMFTRHPFDRLLSAWKDKLVIEPKDHHGNYYKILTPRIFEKINKTLPNVPLDKIDIPFEYVVEYLQKGGYDQHMVGPYDSWCKPCLIPYNYIGKTETFRQDIAYIVNKHMKGRGVSTRRNSWGAESSRTARFNKTLTEFKQLTDGQLKFLSQMYYKDFGQFGYTWNITRDGMSVGCDGACC